MEEKSKPHASTAHSAVVLRRPKTFPQILQPTPPATLSLTQLFSSSRHRLVYTRLQKLGAHSVRILGRLLLLLCLLPGLSAPALAHNKDGPTQNKWVSPEK